MQDYEVSPRLCAFNIFILTNKYLQILSSASFKYWKLPKLPLPFRAKGYLDFVYLDEDLRITRGNRGGLFVHVREGVL